MNEYNLINSAQKKAIVLELTQIPEDLLESDEIDYIIEHYLLEYSAETKKNISKLTKDKGRLNRFKIWLTAGVFASKEIAYYGLLPAAATGSIAAGAGLVIIPIAWYLYLAYTLFSDKCFKSSLKNSRESKTKIPYERKMLYEECYIRTTKQVLKLIDRDISSLPKMKDTTQKNTLKEKLLRSKKMYEKKLKKFEMKRKKLLNKRKAKKIEIYDKNITKKMFK